MFTCGFVMLLTNQQNRPLVGWMIIIFTIMHRLGIKIHPLNVSNIHWYHCNWKYCKQFCSVLNIHFWCSPWCKVNIVSFWNDVFFYGNTYQMDSWLNTIWMTSSFWAPCYYRLFYFSPSLVLFFPSRMYWSGTAYKGIFCFSPLSWSFTTNFCFSPPGSIDSFIFDIWESMRNV
jgi:hypothetical protein